MPAQPGLHHHRLGPRARATRLAVSGSLESLLIILLVIVIKNKYMNSNKSKMNLKKILKKNDKKNFKKNDQKNLKNENEKK